MMIECKAVEVNLDEKVLEQVLRYNVSVPVTFIVITNGEKTYAWQRLTSGLEMLEDIPDKI